jgi:hypothetical protein
VCPLGAARVTYSLAIDPCAPERLSTVTVWLRRRPSREAAASRRTGRTYGRRALRERQVVRVDDGSRDSRHRRPDASTRILDPLQRQGQTLVLNESRMLQLPNRRRSGSVARLPIYDPG